VGVSKKRPHEEEAEALYLGKGRSTNSAVEIQLDVEKALDRAYARGKAAAAPEARERALKETQAILEVAARGIAHAASMIKVELAELERGKK
jgi:hypothetical protein